MRAYDTLKHLGMSLIATVVFVSAVVAADDDIRVEQEQLKAKLDQPEIVILDARSTYDWKKSNRKIVGAVRVDPHNVSSWSDKFPKDAFVVAYCA